MTLKSIVVKRAETINALKSVLGDNFEAKDAVLILEIIMDELEFGLGSDMEAVDDHMEVVFRQLLKDKLKSAIDLIILADTNIGDMHVKLSVKGMKDE